METVPRKNSVSLRVPLQTAYFYVPSLEEETKLSRDGGPYASRTLIGWAVNGPLGRQRHDLQASGFFAKADLQLQRMVEDFYNQDFTDSIINDKTYNSGRTSFYAKRRRNREIELRNGHYQISFAFKSRQVPLQNNIPQAMQRENWLKRKLEREPRLMEDYKAFTEDIASEG